MGLTEEQLKTEIAFTLKLAQDYSAIGAILSIRAVELQAELIKLRKTGVSYEKNIK